MNSRFCRPLRVIGDAPHKVVHKSISSCCVTQDIAIVVEVRLVEFQGIPSLGSSSFIEKAKVLMCSP